MAKVTVMFGSTTESEYNLDKPEMRIGRAMDCDIVVDNLGISRHHCSILKDAKGFVVVDAGSNNGTFVGGVLFGVKTRLTKREMSLLQGVYSRRMMIVKHSYKNEKGQRRILVLLSPTESGKDFRAAVDRSNTYRIASVPIAVALTVVTGLDYLVQAHRLRRTSPRAMAIGTSVRAPWQESSQLREETRISGFFMV